jgi:hypothetical protein
MKAAVLTPRKSLKGAGTRGVAAGAGVKRCDAACASASDGRDYSIV